MDYTKPFLSSFPYFIVTAPTGLSVLLVDVKGHLKLDPSDTSVDNELTLIVSAAASYCEKYTRRTLLTTKFKTFRNSFTPTIELRKSPFQTLDLYEYLVSAAFTTVTSTLYYTTMEEDYSKIYLVTDSVYPTNADEQLQNIKIEFTAGYADDAAALKLAQPELYLALLVHIAALYENRGDCDMASASKSLPNSARAFYDSLKILEIV